MKRFPLLTLLCLLMMANSLFAQGSVPLYTADYYKLKPEQWVGKEVVLSVGKVSLRDDPAKDGTRVLNAFTEFRDNGGGIIEVRAPQAAAERVIRLCGTTYQYSGAGAREMQIKGVYTKGDKSKGEPSYFIKIDK